MKRRSRIISYDSSILMLEMMMVVAMMQMLCRLVLTHWSCICVLSNVNSASASKRIRYNMEHGSPTQMPEPSPTQPIAISFSFKEYIYWNMETNPHLDFQQSWFIWILYLVTSNWLIESCIGISRLATCVKPNPSFLNFWGSTFVERWGKRPFWWEDSIWFTLLSLWLQKHDEMNPGRLPLSFSSELGTELKL